MGARANEYAWDTGAVSPGTVGTSTSVVLPGNPKRRYAALVNNHASQDVYLALGAAAVLGSGIFLKAGGGSYEINANNIFHGDISAIGSGAGTLSIQEGI